MKIKRGDIYLADLGEGYGSEQGGIRPVLVVQNNKGNKHSHTLLVACITSKAHSKHYLLLNRKLNTSKNKIKLQNKIINRWKIMPL